MADVSKLEETGKPIDEQCIRVGAECSRPKCKDCVERKRKLQDSIYVLITTCDKKEAIVNAKKPCF